MPLLLNMSKQFLHFASEAEPWTESKAAFFHNEGRRWESGLGRRQKDSSGWKFTAMAFFPAHSRWPIVTTWCRRSTRVTFFNFSIAFRKHHMFLSKWELLTILVGCSVTYPNNLWFGFCILANASSLYSSWVGQNKWETWLKKYILIQ